jgi:hypothetical protein
MMSTSYVQKDHVGVKNDSRGTRDRPREMSTFKLKLHLTSRMLTSSPVNGSTSTSRIEVN